MMEYFLIQMTVLILLSLFISIPLAILVCFFLKRGRRGKKGLRGPAGYPGALGIAGKDGHTPTKNELKKLIKEVIEESGHFLG